MYDRSLLIQAVLSNVGPSNVVSCNVDKCLVTEDSVNVTWAQINVTCCSSVWHCCF